MLYNDFTQKIIIPFLHTCRLVIETLEGVEKDRKCFRMVGGVLVERKVGEVEPALTSNRDKVSFFGKTLLLERAFGGV